MEIVLMAEQSSLILLTWMRVDSKHKNSLKVINAIHKSEL